MSVNLIAVVKAKPEFSSEVKKILEDMVLHSRKEAACIRYDLHQGVHDKNSFVFYELWKNQKGLDQHNQQPYLNDFRSIVSEKLQENPQIFILDKL